MTRTEIKFGDPMPPAEPKFLIKDASADLRLQAFTTYPLDIDEWYADFLANPEKSPIPIIPDSRLTWKFGGNGVRWVPDQRQDRIWLPHLDAQELAYQDTQMAVRDKATAASLAFARGGRFEKHQFESIGNKSFEALVVRLEDLWEEDGYDLNSARIDSDSIDSYLRINYTGVIQLVPPEWYDEGEEIEADAKDAFNLAIDWFERIRKINEREKATQTAK